MTEALLPPPGRHEAARGDVRPTVHALFFGVQPTAAAGARMFAVGRDLQDRFDLGGQVTPVRRQHVSLCGFHAGLEPPSREIIGLARAIGETIRFRPFDVAFNEAVSWSPRSNTPHLVLRCSNEHGDWGLIESRRLFAMAFRERGLRLKAAFEPHLTLLHGRKAAPATDIAPIRWAVGELVLIHSHQGLGRHDVVGRWPLAR